MTNTVLVKKSTIQFICAWYNSIFDRILPLKMILILRGVGLSNDVEDERSLNDKPMKCATEKRPRTF